MNNQECKVRPEIIILNTNEPVFFVLLVLKKVNVVIAVTLSMILML